jgi:hypothetical protein
MMNSARIKFLGVGRQGEDVYTVRQETARCIGELRWIRKERFRPPGSPQDPETGRAGVHRQLNQITARVCMSASGTERTNWAGC